MDESTSCHEATTVFSFTKNPDELETNVQKLRKRYPDGFSSARSMNREKED